MLPQGPLTAFVCVFLCISPLVTRRAHIEHLVVCAEEKRTYDIVICCDVLPYFGDLVDLFQKVSALALPGTRFLLSTETSLKPITSGYNLEKTARFVHMDSYVERVATDTGWSVVLCRHATLRLNGKEPVKGSLFLLEFKDRFT